MCHRALSLIFISSLALLAAAEESAYPDVLGPGFQLAPVSQPLALGPDQVQSISIKSVSDGIVLTPRVGSALKLISRYEAAELYAFEYGSSGLRGLLVLTKNGGTGISVVSGSIVGASRNGLVEIGRLTLRKDEYPPPASKDPEVHVVRRISVNRGLIRLQEVHKEQIDEYAIVEEDGRILLWRQ
jgi:hypothetical protein